MPVPALPREIWFHISKFLDTKSLSSVSQVNKVLNTVATDESHFRRFTPTSSDCHTHPAQLYRRQQAVLHPPNTYLSIQGTSTLNIFCTVQDSLLLIDDDANALTAFPSGATFRLQHVLGPFTPTDFEGPPYFSFPFFLRKVSTILPDGHIAFVYDYRPERLAVLNVVSGKVAHWRIDREREVSDWRIVNGASIFSAGNDGEWIVFHATECTISVFNWRTGTLVKNVTVLPGKAKVLMGECPAIDGMSVVGVLSEKTDELTKEVHCRGFDDDEVIFKIEDNDFGDAAHIFVDVALRSTDKKTYVVITSLDENGALSKFLACRKCSDGITWWESMLSIWTHEENGDKTWPELRENGRVIALKSAETLTGSIDGNKYLEDLWIELNDDGTTEDASLLELSCGSDTQSQYRPIWHRRTYNGGLALIAGSGYKGNTKARVVDLMKVERKEITIGIPLRRWICSNSSDWCVVRDHFLVAKRKNGNLSIIHCDEFCRGTEGIYKCPGLIPDKYTVKRCEARAIL